MILILFNSCFLHLLVLFLVIITNTMDLTKLHHKTDSLSLDVSTSNAITWFRGVLEHFSIPKVTTLGVGYDLANTVILVDPHVLSVRVGYLLLLLVPILTKQNKMLVLDVVLGVD